MYCAINLIYFIDTYYSKHYNYILISGGNMSSEITSSDKIWKTFLGYNSLISSDATKEGIDMFGTELRYQIAAHLTAAHYSDHISCQLKENARQKFIQQQRNK